MLTLPIKKKWFDMILSGEKCEEYRNITPRYSTMFRNAATSRGDGTFWVRLRNGYSLSSPSVLIRVSCQIGMGKTEWGAEPGVEYFRLLILDIKE